MFDADDRLLVRSGVPFGILVSPDSSMRVVSIDPENPLPAPLAAESADSATTRSGIVFWFNANPPLGAPINRMAVLHLLAVSGLAVHAIPLLRGPVLIGASNDGRPAGLTNEHLAELNQTPQPLWWWPEMVLSWRALRDNRRRHRRG